MGFDVSAGILIILGPTVWPLCMGQDFRLRITADELANGPSPKKEMAIGEVVKPFLCVFCRFFAFTLVKIIEYFPISFLKTSYNFPGFYWSDFSEEAL